MLSHVIQNSASFWSFTLNIPAKSNFARLPVGANGPSGPRWVPSYVANTPIRSPSAAMWVKVCTLSGNTAASSRRKALKSSRLRHVQMRRRLAVADEVGRDDVVERVEVAPVHGDLDPFDQGTHVLRGHRHRDPLGVVPNWPASCHAWYADAEGASVGSPQRSSGGAGPMQLVIRGGTVVTAGWSGPMDVGVDGSQIVQLGGPMHGDDELDATGHYVLPGGVDPHVHLTAPTNHPGERTWVDDFESGTRAALAGGITTVGNITFPYPGTTMATALERDEAVAGATSLVDYFLHPVLRDSDDANLAEIDELVHAGHSSIKIFLSFRRFDRNVDQLPRGHAPLWRRRRHRPPPLRGRRPHGLLRRRPAGLGPHPPAPLPGVAFRAVGGHRDGSGRRLR